jgi:ribosome-associated protein
MKLSNTISIPEQELNFAAIRASGPGGQNVNKVSSAVQLFFDIRNSSLPEKYQQRLLALSDSRISSEGLVVIKAQAFRSQEKNREAATERLRELIKSVMIEPKTRKATKPKAGARQKRLDEKKQRSQNKALRKRVSMD